MIIECFLCGKAIESANTHNADYIILPTKLTAIICPACYLEGDVLIWGYHKTEECTVSMIDKVKAAMRRMFKL